MAFEALTDKFSKIIKRLKGEHKLTESNMDSILKDIRLALLEADVNFKVVKEFIAKIKEKCLGLDVYDKLNPSEMVVKIVREELTTLLGSGKSDIFYQKNRELANSIDVTLFEMGTNTSPIEIAKKADEAARLGLYDVLIIDTAGRLSIDEALMQELNDINNSIEIDEKLLVVDALSGQESLNVANSFNEKVGLTGVIMTKLDGDSRGGAALSIASATSLGIKFAGVGEKISDLDIFYPDRMADRILGMGDILTLVDKVSDNIDEKEAKKSVNKLMEGRFTLDDMLKQMKQIQKMGSMKGLLKLIPGMPSISDEQQELLNKEMRSFEAIINSMTPEERADPSILKNSRKVRIAKGSGKTNADINRVLKKYEQMQMMMKQMKGKKGGMLPPGFKF